MKTKTILRYLPRLAILLALFTVLFLAKPVNAATFPLFPLDTTPPSVPTGLSVAPQEAYLSVSWAAASDNVGVTEYEVWRDGSLYKTTTKLSFIDYAVVPGQEYSYEVRAKDASNNYSALSAAVVRAPTSTNVWGETLPAVEDGGDGGSIELGMKFTPKQDGKVTGVRFYKAPANTGAHIGNLWSTTGANLGSVVFSGETASGWQEATFATPIDVTAGTTYIVSYFAPNGHYSIDRNYFNITGMETPYILVPKNTAGNENGVFAYGAGPTFPNSNFNAGNYWVDVAFAPEQPAPLLGTNPSATTLVSPLLPTPLTKAGMSASMSGGDGWRPIPYGDAIYNIGHHQEVTSTYPAIYATDRVTGQQLPGYPKALNSGDPTMPTDLVSVTHTTEFLDREGAFGPAGAVYIGVQRMNQSEVGVACFNLETGTGCGYTPVGNTVGNTSGAGGFSIYAILSAGYEAEGIFHSLTSDGRLVRMDIASRTALPPVSLNFPDSTDQNGAYGPALYKVGDKLIAYIRYNASSIGALQPLGTRMQCYDPATGAICSGWPATPITLPSTANNPAHTIRGTTPMLTGAGEEDGFCTFWIEGATEGAYCFGLDGTPRTVPPVLLSPTEIPNPVFDTGHLPGTARTYIPYRTEISPTVVYDTYMCFDWATMARCADFGDTPGSLKTWDPINNGNLATYGIVYDEAGGCMLALGDRSWMVAFSPITGNSPCQTLKYTSVVDPVAAYCDNISLATTWRQLDLYNIDPSLVDTAQVTLRDSNGAIVPGFEDIVITPGSPLDISAIPATGATQQLTIELEMTTHSNWSWQDGQPSIAASFNGDTFNLEADDCTLSRIGASVFEDTNNNGVHDSGEAPLPGVEVALLNDAGFTVAVTTVQPDGTYEFTNLAPGNYAVQFRTPTGYQSSPLVVGTGTGMTSDADPNSDVATRFVTLTGGNALYVMGAGFLVEQLPEPNPNPNPNPTPRPETPNQPPQLAPDLADTSSQLPQYILLCIGLLALSAASFRYAKKR
ncbi:MAG TPA: DUF4082 domain-containing protein [Verrucomicrobiae bacterium]|nr:DUF4082 domain-containing protein [Verrucomicrobiae bacterium]